MRSISDMPSGTNSVMSLPASLRTIKPVKPVKPVKPIITPATIKPVTAPTPELQQLYSEAKKYKTADEFIQTKMARETDFADYHQAPRMDKTPVKKRMDDGGDFSLREVANGKTTAPSDFFDEKVGARYYMYDDLEGQQSFTAINNIIRAEKNGIKDWEMRYLWRDSDSNPF